MNPKVSVIICTFNRASLLKEAIESVRSQTFQDWELIVINDGSNDETPSVLTDYAHIDQRIHFINQKNSGLGASRASGPKLAKGEYLAFLDDDDLFSHDKLQNQVSYLDANSEIGLVYGYVDMVNNEKEFLRQWPTRPAQNFIELIRQCTIQPNACLVRKKCFEKLGSFNQNLNGSDDYEMWLRIAKHFPIAFRSETVGVYRWHNRNLSLDQTRSLRKLLSTYKTVLNSYVLTADEKSELYKSVLFLTYFKALEDMNKFHFKNAALRFAAAIIFDPCIGIHLTWSRIDHPIYKVLKPYLAWIYCSLKGLKQPVIPLVEKFPCPQ